MQKIEHNSLCETESYKVMTDNEIIKALECCKEAVSTGCKDCPFGDYGTNTCITVLSETALDLINRLQKSNGNWRRKCQRLRKALRTQKAEIEEKNECLTAQADTIFLYEQVIKDKTAEIERLQNSFIAQARLIEKKSIAYDRICIKHAKELKISKNEAIKEFATRLHNNFISKVTKYHCRVNDRHSYKFLVGYLVDDVLSNIDNLVKEMTEQ